MNTETHKLTTDLDRRILAVDQKIEKAEQQRQRADNTLADLYKTRMALLAANEALMRDVREAAE